MKFILRDHDRVSAERILSGRGLVNLHRALCAIDGASFTPIEADKITEAAINGDGPAQKTLNLFCSLLGRAAGDAALATGARGGVVLGERQRVNPPHYERDSILFPKNASRHGHRSAQQRLGFFEAR